MSRIARVGFVSIGQSPRADILDDIIPAIDENRIVVSECGALDGFSQDEINSSFSREDDSFVLVSRMRDGSEAMFTKKFVIGHVQRCIDKMEEENDLLVLLCASKYPELHSEKLLIRPYELMLDVVKSLTKPQSRIGILIPSQLQEKELKEEWNSFENVEVFPISPYTSELNDFTEIASKLKGFDLGVMDCLGYSVKMKKKLMEKVNISVIIPRIIIADMLNELIL